MLLTLAGALVSPSNQASAAVVCAPRQSSYSGVVSSTPGLVGYWRLGESSGTTACDSTGHDNGTYLTGTTLGVSGAISGDPDTAVTLNGSSGQVSVPAASSLNVGDNFTIEAWVKRGSSKTGVNQVVASKQEGSWVLMFNESDKLTLRRSTVADIATSTVATTDTSGWHYVVATKNGSSVHLYLDGVDVTGAVSNQTMPNNSQPLVIGQSTGTAYFKGSVDETALYNTALTPTQITQHYNAGISAPGDPVLAAVGDIACPFGDTGNACQQQLTAALTASQHPNAVAVLGDNQYNSGLLSEYNSSGAYNDTWGQFNPIVHPTPGNHEYAASLTASGYFTYFGAAAENGNYSYELGSWHVVSLNSDCSNSGCEDSIAGTSSSAEVSWLQADLAAHQNQCILAYWHHPRFSSGWVGSSPGVAPLWSALYAAHADVVLNGHDHMYERFAQQDPSQNPTSEGIREFVVGTGGESLFTMGTIQPNMQAVDNTHFGALFLTLHPGSYDWTYRATNGSVLDSGTSACHLQPSGAQSASSAQRATFGHTALALQSSSRIHAPYLAVRMAARYSVAPSAGLARLTFAAHPQRDSLRSALKRGLPIRVYCSRACDIGVTIRMRRGNRTLILARYRETETEVPRPSSTLVLRLRQSLFRHLRGVPLTMTLAATDASKGQQRVTRTIILGQ
jgi:acid phosphatase type 7